MSRIEFAPQVADDLDHIVGHLRQHGTEEVLSRIEDIIRAIDVLERNPEIGRVARTDLRELVIGRRSRVLVALYRYVPELDTIFVLAVRAQREAGFKDR